MFDYYFSSFLIKIKKIISNFTINRQISVKMRSKAPIKHKNDRF